MNSISTSLALGAAVLGSLLSAFAPLGGFGIDDDGADEVTPGGIKRPVNCTVTQTGGQTNELWWFGGADAAFYSERVRLTAKGKGFSFVPPLTWTVVRGQDKVMFTNGQDQITSSTFRTTLVATAPSDGGATVAPDVRIRVANAQGLFCEIDTVVFTADHLIPLGELSFPQDSGYYTDLKYRTEDQFNRVLPNFLELNNDWDADTSDFTGENWVWRNESAVFIGPFNWSFRIDRSAPIFTIPPAMAPQFPRSTLKVDHRDGAYRHGSTAVQTGPNNNGGIVVETLRFQTYDDHAAQE